MPKIKMKKNIKYLLLIAFCAIGTELFAQVSFSCTYREYCSWNEASSKFEDCKGYDESSLFVMNEAESMFEHTIESMKSTYYVTSKEYDDENDVYAYDVTSDVGNKYYFIFDPNNKEVRAVYTDKDNNAVLIRWYVKAIF